jgi:hypothetical protein
MLVGGPSAVAHLASSLVAAKHAGYLPVAAYTPGVQEVLSTEPESGLPVLGHEPEAHAILEAIDRCQADAVAVSAGVQCIPKPLGTLGGSSRRGTLAHHGTRTH